VSVQLSEEEGIVKRERMLQIILASVGLFHVALIYPLYMDLRSGDWPLQMKNECEPMFLSLYIAQGVFLLLATKRPSAHRSLISFAAWSNLAHALVMAIQTVEAWSHGIHRDFTDVVIAGVIGGVLLALAPAKQGGGDVLVKEPRTEF
jgi:hypothetical protein